MERKQRRKRSSRKKSSSSRNIDGVKQKALRDHLADDVRYFVPSVHSLSRPEWSSVSRLPISSSVRSASYPSSRRASYSSSASSTSRRRWRLEREDFLFSAPDASSSKQVQQFYDNQRRQVEGFLKAQANASIEKAREFSDQSTESIASLEESQSPSVPGAVVVAIYGSFFLNIVLFAVKCVVFGMSGSFAVLASALDSFIDLLSGGIIFTTAWLMKRPNVYQFPAGNSRMEPLGIIVLSTIMFTATLMLLIEAIGALIASDKELELDYFAVSILIAVVVVKFFLWLYCISVLRRHKSHSVEALAGDHLNDTLTNTIGAAAAIAASFWHDGWFLDPAGACVIAVYIMWHWGHTAWEHITMLAGKSAPPQLLNQLTFICWNHDKRVIAIDTVRAFHLSFGYMAEIDIVLPEAMSLKEAHDIGEELQFKLERLDEVERAFVHLDYEVSHAPEHRGGIPHHILQERERKKTEALEEDV